MQAVIKQTRAPDTNALKTKFKTDCFLLGISPLMVEIMMPIEPGFEKPHRAYVAINLVRPCNQTNVNKKILA